MYLCSISSQAWGSFFFPAEDILIHEDKTNPTWMFSIDFTEKKEYIIFYTMKDTSRVSKAGQSSFSTKAYQTLRKTCCGLQSIIKRMESDQTSSGTK